MLLGYIEHDRYEEGFLLPNTITFFGMLKACGNKGELVVHTKMKLDFVMGGGIAI